MGETRGPWSPWQHMRRHWPHITIYEDDLPDGILGCTNYTDSIWLTYGLTCAEQRCTLAHEIGHLERGAVPKDPLLAATEEQAVDLWAASQLIRLPDLIAAMRWTRQLHEAAEELWVDSHTLTARLRSLTDLERDILAITFGDEVA